MFKHPQRLPVARPLIAACALTSAWLALGCAGFRYLDGFSWLDAFHQSAMLIAGMGPIKPTASAAGVLFDSLYAITSGLVMLGAAGLLFAPALHYLLHRAHVDPEFPG